MSDKYNNFLKDLKQLCLEHNVILTTSEYDLIQVWDEDSEDPADYWDCFQDRTK